MIEATSSIDEELERARVAWLYFNGGQTQQEIAKRMNITRLKVNKIIGQVRLSGHVQVNVNLPLTDCIELADKMSERYGLMETVVVPDLDDYMEQKRVIGEAAGTLASGLIEGRDMGVGIGSGRTLSFAVRSVQARPKFDSWVVGLTGGVTSGSASNSFGVATTFAHMLGVECHYLTAPIYCVNPESRNALLLNDEITDVLARTEIADIGIVSCGNLELETSLTQIRVVKDNFDAVLKLGAVGEFMGYFLNASGEPIDHFLNNSVIALPPDKMKLKPISILVSGGLRKIPIMRAILRGGYVNRLVTNESVAHALLQGPR
ncbi:sugar-binding transcriptional regulator [Cohaesibacter celericrescens]|uniref:DNA-binding transcriptional regulator n=1 Tax=Cohaesibacter celericrescens TaxID=2067669 RepID=A0A2N5XLK6_9HYPH|nr:sugar-binding domain-containing protein [Cohaesibacter celericrescens]PLW75383.1 DNA-binding transcriptional regulator [Cohaesibacter celericrescens]